MSNSKNKNKIIILGKYLISKDVLTPLRMQKLLFFFRVEEIKTGNISGYFEQDKNFQAWIYGPVNDYSYKFFQYYFWGKDEKDKYLLTDKEFENMDKIFGKVFDKYNEMSDDELVEKARRNKSWLKARNGIKEMKPCQTTMIEDDDFINFL